MGRLTISTQLSIPPGKMRESRSPTTTLRYLFHAGMPETQFHPWWHEGTVYSKTKVEDTVAMLIAHPLWDEYWETKRADFSKITVPAYVVASWSDHGLHTRGTLEAYKALGSEQRWLRSTAARSGPTTTILDQSLARQRAFFNHFLKGEDTEVTSWPPVGHAPDDGPMPP